LLGEDLAAALREVAAAAAQARRSTTMIEDEHASARPIEAGEPAERLLEARPGRWREPPDVRARAAGIALPRTPCDRPDWR
jgi:hypothetical protein